MKKNLEVGEWQTDQNGKRFRMIGGFIQEYETEVMTTCGNIPESRMKTLKNLKENPRLGLPEKVQYCPLRDFSKCIKECVFFSDEKCLFGDHGENTGKVCPFTRRPCSENCGFNRDGKCKF